MEKTENEKVKTKRELLTERLKNRYPDKDFSNEDDFFGQISDDYDESDKNLAGYQEREKAFSDMFTGDPRSAQFITDWRNGEDPEVALVRRHGKETILDAINDPEKLEAIANANKEYVERVAKEKELEDMYQANLAESIKALEAMPEANGITDEDVDKAVEFLLGIIRDGIIGKIAPESVMMALKAINHDTDVETANQEGLVQGKNTKIKEELRKPKSGDGTTPLGGGSSAPRPRTGGYSIFDEARGAN